MALAVLILSLGSSVATAQQLQNAGFDANLQSWTDPGYPDRLLSWNSEDSAGSMMSGSLLHVADDSSGGIGLGLHQCVDVQPGATYSVGGEAYIPAGQVGSIAPYVFVEEHIGTGCQNYTGRDWFAGPFTTVGSWGTFQPFEAAVDQATGSVRINLGAWVSESGVDLEAHFDDIVFTLAGEPPIFVDGFEDGTTSAWTSTSP